MLLRLKNIYSPLVMPSLQTAPSPVLLSPPAPPTGAPGPSEDASSPAPPNGNEYKRQRESGNLEFRHEDVTHDKNANALVGDVTHAFKVSWEKKNIQALEEERRKIQ